MFITPSEQNLRPLSQSVKNKIKNMPRTFGISFKLESFIVLEMYILLYLQIHLYNFQI